MQGGLKAGADIVREPVRQGQRQLARAVQDRDDDGKAQRPLQLAPPSTQNRAQWGWLSGTEPRAWAKLIIDEEDDRILGAHIFGHAGEELIHFFALAMAQGTTAVRLREMVYAFPTFSADIKYLL